MRIQVVVLLILVAVANAPRLRWRDGHRMPLPKSGAATALLGSRMVLAGGSYWEAGQKHWATQVDVYEISSDQWRSGPGLPFPLAYGACVRSEGRLEVLGGWDGTRIHKEILTLDAGLSRWIASGSLPEGRVYGRAEKLGAAVYLVGGSSDAADFSRATDSLLSSDAATRSEWKSRTPIPGGPRALHASAVAGSRLFVFGGCRIGANGDLINLADSYSYEPQTDQWKRLADLPQPVRSLSATAVGSRFIYLFGGYVATAAETRTKPLDYGFTPAVYVYDIETNHYEKRASLPIPVSDINFVAHGHALYGAGGEDRNYGRSARTLIARFDP